MTAQEFISLRNYRPTCKLLLIIFVFSSQYVECIKGISSDREVDYTIMCASCDSSDEIIDCRCDDKCILYGDCCKEKYDTFNQSQIKETIMSTATCQYISKIAYYIIGSCDSSWNNEYIRDLCEIEADDILNNLPVFDSNGDHYGNIYCAVCNSIPMEDMTTWIVFEVIGSFPISSIDDITYGLPDDLPENLLPRPCRDMFIDRCDYTPDGYGRKCPGYFAPSYYQKYKNPECAACNGFPLDVENCSSLLPPGYDSSSYYISVDLEYAIEPYIPPNTDFNPLTILFGTSDNGVKVTELTKLCKNGEVFDSFREICIVIFCSNGYVLINGQCQSVICKRWVLQFTVNTTIYQNHEANKTLSCILSNLQNVGGSSALYQFSQFYSELHINDQLQLQFELISNRDYSLLRHDLLTLFPSNEIKTNQYGILCNVSSLQVDQFCADFDKPENCSSIGVSIEENVFPIIIRNQTMLHINQSDSYHSIDASLFSHHYKRDSSGFASTTLLFPCSHENSDLTCPYIIDNLVNYLSLNNTLQHKETEDVYNYGSYEVLDNETVKICSRFNQSGTTSKVYYFVPYNNAQTILSVVGCILSLIALAFTFIVYCLLPSLRTLPGKSIMSLTVALFAAQFILTFGAGQTNNSIICTLIAVAMHFFWLASFFWMSVLAYDVSKTFNNTHNRSKEINRKSFTNYSTTAWGTPFVIVTICFVLSLNVKSLDFDYGSPYVCWISNNVASLIIFGGPVLSSVCLNIILFGLTVHGVRGTMKTSSTLRSSRSTSHSTCSELKIYVKITSLMGFSWIFGFVATFTGAEILWYFFIVLCSLQGVFILMSFVCNARVYGLMCEKYQIHRQPTSSGSLAMTHTSTIMPT